MEILSRIRYFFCFVVTICLISILLMGMYTEIAYGAPERPDFLWIKSGNGEILEKDGKIFTNNEEVILAWNRCIDASSYEVEFNDSAYSDDWIFGIYDTEAKFSDAKKSKNTEGTYRVRVRALDSEGWESDLSDPIIVVIDRSTEQPTLPSNPLQIVINGQNTTDITFNWNTVEDVVGIAKYQVALSQSLDSPAVNEIIDVLTNQYTFYNVNLLNSYSFYVRAVDELGNLGPWTRCAGNDLLDAPIVVIEQEIDNDNWKEIWGISGINGGGVFLYHSKKNKLWWLLCGDGIHPTQYVTIGDSITPYGNTYFYKVTMNPTNVKVEIYNVSKQKVGELSIDNPNYPVFADQ